MNRKKKYDNRAKFEIRQERIAVMIMIICVLPILYIYGKFSVSYTHLTLPTILRV